MKMKKIKWRNVIIYGKYGEVRFPNTGESLDVFQARIMDEYRRENAIYGYYLDEGCTADGGWSRDEQAELFSTMLPADLERERKLAADHWAAGGGSLFSKQVAPDSEEARGMIAACMSVDMTGAVEEAARLMQAECQPVGLRRYRRATLKGHEKRSASK